jgi:hypothetical protein
MLVPTAHGLCLSVAVSGETPVRSAITRMTEGTQMTTEDEARRYLALLRRTINHCQSYHFDRLAEHRREALKSMERMREDLKAAGQCTPLKDGGKR